MIARAAASDVGLNDTLRLLDRQRRGPSTRATRREIALDNRTAPRPHGDGRRPEDARARRGNASAAAAVTPGPAASARVALGTGPALLQRTDAVFLEKVRLCVVPQQHVDGDDMSRRSARLALRSMKRRRARA
jgi:hypothetical protein